MDDLFEEMLHRLEDLFEMAMIEYPDEEKVVHMTREFVWEFMARCFSLATQAPVYIDGKLVR